VSWFIRIADTGPDLLEVMRPIALSQVADDDPFASLREVSFKTQAGALVLRDLATRFEQEGRIADALAQLRNATTIAGAYGADVSADWCRRLAELSQRVEPHGLSAQLAELAARVQHLGA
jgi:hypothetical protein